MHDEVLARCRAALPGWRELTVADVEFDAPKGFSSFTMGVRPLVAVDPPAVLYRHLAGKENAILDAAAERDVFLLLGEHHIAAHCYHADDVCRIEEFYTGRTLTADDLTDHEVLGKIADQLYRFHQIEPGGLPAPTFFELLHARWGPMARSVLDDRRDEFPADERALCDDLTEMLADRTLSMVLRCLPDPVERPPVFCHNDTYHGNVMLLTDGSIRLLDFEFSCRNHVAFDFANLFAETVMVHGLADPPHFTIGDPAYTDDDIGALVGAYLDNAGFATSAARAAEHRTLVDQTRRAIMLSDYMYAMAALPLALQPIQKIRFLPYDHRRFHRFLDSWQREFGNH